MLIMLSVDGVANQETLDATKRHQGMLTLADGTTSFWAYSRLVVNDGRITALPRMQAIRLLAFVCPKCNRAAGVPEDMARMVRRRGHNVICKVDGEKMVPRPEGNLARTVAKIGDLPKGGPCPLPKVWAVYKGTAPLAWEPSTERERTASLRAGKKNLSILPLDMVTPLYTGSKVSLRMPEAWALDIPSVGKVKSVDELYNPPEGFVQGGLLRYRPLNVRHRRTDLKA